jgi:hypothetical protein
MKKKIHEKNNPIFATSNVALDDLILSMYKSVTKLQEIQTSFPSPISRSAILGMSADISKMLMRFRKITSAIKTGDDKRIEKSIEETRLRSLVSELIVEELKKR